jgi:hypothetical protein
VVRIDRTTLAILLVITLAGGVLRLAAPRDYEFKKDEAAMVELVQRARTSGELPWLGMPTSQGVRNPGMSVWPFVALSYVFGSDGFGLTQAVRALNVFALVAAIGFALWRLGGDDQRLWLAGLLLAAVNPMEVVLHRKLWAQSVLPILALLVLWLWLDRHKSWRHAAGLGAGLAVLAQVHLSGIFIAAALLVGARWDRRGREIQWIALALGFAALAWPFYYWVENVLSFVNSPAAEPRLSSSAQSWLLNVVSLRYFHLLLTNLSGVSMRHSLGSHFDVFVAQPFVAVAHVALVAITLVAVGRWLLRRCPVVAGELKGLLVWGLLGTGVLMTVAGVFGQRHYYLGLFPLPYVLFAVWLDGDRRWWPISLVAGLQLVISVAFLVFIHMNGGAPGAEFGPLP